MEENQNQTPQTPQTTPASQVSPEDLGDMINDPTKPRVRDLYGWRSLNRAVKTYSKEVFSTLGAIALLVSVILAFFQEWLAIFVTWATFFLFWQINRFPPEEVDHKITTEGIVSMKHSYIWAELGPFWFTEKEKEDTLHVAHGNVFGELTMIIDKADQEKIRNLLAAYLPCIEVPEKSAVEKFSDWFARKFPLEPAKTSTPPPANPPSTPQPPSPKPASPSVTPSSSPVAPTPPTSITGIPPFSPPKGPPATS